VPELVKKTRDGKASEARRSASAMTGFEIREWHLEPYDGDQAPPHVHHTGQEAFVCISGDLEVMVGGTREPVLPGTFLVVPPGTAHTFAARGGAHVIAVMSPEIAELIDGLHARLSDEERQALWQRCRSSLA
jgi:mannose-6-phosphate isomerase-like protein (cupin superfamily)